MARRRIVRGVFVAVALAGGLPISAHQIVDRIAARVENDIILQSQVRKLARYQQLLEGKSESDAVLLDRLVDQWIVRTEAQTAHFPQPSEAEIRHGVERVASSFSSPQAYEEKKRQLNLADAEIREMVAEQLYLSTYLDSRFRPAIQVDPKAVEEFYNASVITTAKTRGKEPPSLEASRDVIHEALVQKGIDEQAEKWLKESRSHLHIEKVLAGDLK